ncbi:MAG TPA: DUF3048 domain-containing protein [Candidatus Saccharimonadaceae bacterium]|nr:DUF3048 domain-containing protein [Candidatus Saccharimonadaceae bacterium]
MNENQQEKKSLSSKLTDWVRHHKKLAILFGVLTILIVGGGVTAGLMFFNQPAAAPTQQVAPTAPEPEPEPPKYYSNLTGELVKNEAASDALVTAIMIENSPNARPQSGLKDSGVVFEAIAEGGITRFLVLYQNEKPELIGPVRSLRMYYVDWLAAFNPSVAHIGGSAKALQEIRNGEYRDIDQFFNPGAYWRSTDRYAPHNVYTSFERLDALNRAKGYKESNFTGFTRFDSEPAEEPTATKLSVSISSPTYNSAYTYDAKTNLYNRSQGGGPHLDREEGQIAPRVVIVMKTPMERVFEDGYREQIKTIGSGEAHIFQDGTVQKVTWQKKSRTSQITFTDKDGDDVPLARGQTWITAVPTTGGVSWQ